MDGDEKLRLLAIGRYATDARPSHQPFVRALLMELVAQGVEVTVVAPEPLAGLLKASSGRRLAPKSEVRDGIAIHRPRYLGYSAIPLPVLGSTRRLGDLAYRRAALRAALGLGRSFDLCYGHFLYPHGAAALAIGRRLGIPAIASLGESSFARYEAGYDTKAISDLLRRFDGVIANSPELHERCVGLHGVPESSVRLLPNGVDRSLFSPLDREEARRQCGLPSDRPIVISVGQWSARKGPERILEAIRSRPEVGAVFLGKGPLAPEGPQVLHRGEVPHGEVATWLSAADVFVLPTLNEGCSNAILEAFACGLPVVTSDLPFNRAIADDDCAVLVDPQDPSAIGRAIGRLVDDPELRSRMAAASLSRAESFQLEDRASRIIQFFRSRVDAEPEPADAAPERG
jgi:glycosyltransferase involved in cell wall biosynthesis